ncbi:MAG: CopG family transcriptional regulator [Verrucomicrobia bacterium]|nr:CopG family transcriptional regulator [Verrucomicrobiota bacterium]
MTKTKTKAKAKSAEEFDRRFDAGEDALELADFQPVKEFTRINVDLPREFVSQLDKAASVRGVTRQSLIKMWLYDLVRKEP